MAVIQPDGDAGAFLRHGGGLSLIFRRWLSCGSEVEV